MKTGTSKMKRHRATLQSEKPLKRQARSAQRRRRPIGTFSYCKTFSSTEFRVNVHLMQVEATTSDYPEKDIRPSRWVPAFAAADEVDRATLRAFLNDLYS